MRLVVSLAFSAVLLAPTAFAQTDFDLTATYGNNAAERLLFPRGADPSLTVGVQIGEAWDAHVGFSTTERRWTGYSTSEVLAVETRDRTQAAVASVGYTRRIGRPLVRTRLSLGTDHFTAQRTTFTPDSTTIRTRTGLVRGFGLVGDREEREGLFLHSGASVTLALPVGSGRLRAAPGIGLAGTVTTRIGGEMERQGAHWMPFIEAPVSVRVRRLDVMVQLRGGVSKTEFQRLPFGLPVSQRQASPSWRATVEGSVGVQF